MGGLAGGPPAVRVSPLPRGPPYGRNRGLGSHTETESLKKHYFPKKLWQKIFVKKKTLFILYEGVN